MSPQVAGSSPPMRAVPAGGVSGQVLAKASAADGDVSWQSTAQAGGMAPVYVSGYWYDGRSRQSAMLQMGLTGGQCFYAPMWIGASVTISALGVVTAGTQAATIYLGLLSSDSAGNPDQLLTSGSIVTSTSAGQAVTVSSLALTAGLYYTAFGATTASSVTVYGQQVSNARTLPTGSSVFTPSSHLPICLLDSSTAVPRSAPPGLVASTSTFPNMWVRVA